MKKNILVSSFLSLLIATVSASAEEYVCPSDGGYVSSLFKANWHYSPERNMDFSFVELTLADKPFRGTLQTTKLSEDKDPHLTFKQIKLSLARERHAWLIDCKYTIGNTAMTGSEDGYLHVSSIVTLDKQCKQVNNIAVSCG